MILEVVFRTTSTCGIAAVGDGKEGDWSNSVKLIKVHVSNEH